MTLRVIGAGLPRTGTLSQQAALVRLLDAPCYHMAELFDHPEHLPVWQAAATGEDVDWRAFYAGYAGAVDWPAAMYWRELMDVFPDAPVLLSVRDSPETWWRSMDRTILTGIRQMHAGDPDGTGPPRLSAFAAAMRRGAGGLVAIADDPSAGVAFYQRHVAEVRATVPAERLVVWQPGDGWEPIAAALGVSVPDEPFPHVNDSADFAQNFQGRARRFLEQDG